MLSLVLLLRKGILRHSYQCHLLRRRTKNTYQLVSAAASCIRDVIRNVTFPKQRRTSRVSSDDSVPMTTGSKHYFWFSHTSCAISRLTSIQIFGGRLLCDACWKERCFYSFCPSGRGGVFDQVVLRPSLNDVDWRARAAARNTAETGTEGQLAGNPVTSLIFRTSYTWWSKSKATFSINQSIYLNQENP